MSSTSHRDAYHAFTTGCALITTVGTDGPNVMAAEWTFNVSYEPFLILVAVDPGNRTHDVILESKEFGVNLIADDQIAAMGFAGHYSKSDTDKLSSELFVMYPGKRIRAPMIRGALLNAECRLVESYRMGDHTAFVGEVVDFTAEPEKAPLVLHHGSHRLGERITREPGLIVSATPMRAGRGTAVIVTGELTGPDREGTPVAIRVLGSNGAPAVETTAKSGVGGGFSARLELPATLPAGTITLEARGPGVEGRARIDIL